MFSILGQVHMKKQLGMEKGTIKLKAQVINNAHCEVIHSMHKLTDVIKPLSHMILA